MGNKKIPYIVGAFIVALMMVQTAMGEVSRTGLVAEWHFDGDAKDSSGNGIDGTLYGATFVDGKIGKALAFNGVNDYADFGEGGGKLDFGTGAFSIEFWTNYQGTTVHPNVTDIMGKTIGGADTPGFFSWTTTWGGDGSNYGLFVATSTASWGYGNVEHWGAYLPNTWYHVVFVREGNTWTIYKNGLYAASRTSEGIGLNVNNNINFKIGDSTSSPNFKGVIDEVRIYSGALSANEVKANYEAGKIIVTSSPSGAEILVNGQSRGIASPALSIYGVSPGTYSIKCKLNGYEDYDVNAVLTAGGVASISCPLKPVSTATPALVISPTPPGISTQPATAPLLSVSKEPFTFNSGNMNIGESSSLTFTISNGGGGTLAWKVSADQPWISINPESGINTGTIRISINTAAMEPGSYSGILSVTSNGGTKTGSISMNLLPATKIVSKTSNNTPQLSVSHEPFIFNSGTMIAGESGSLLFSISNTGGGTLIWSVIDDQPWITINPTSGTDSGAITVNINTTGLKPGSYSGAITIDSNGGTKKGTVLLTVYTPEPAPATAPPVTLVQIMGVILVLAGLLLTTLTTFKKDVSLEFGISERNLKYVGGAGILFVLIGGYILLKSTLPV